VLLLLLLLLLLFQPCMPLGVGGGGCWLVGWLAG
jgi:hypothetical protein